MGTELGTSINSWYNAKEWYNFLVEVTTAKSKPSLSEKQLERKKTHMLDQLIHGYFCTCKKFEIYLQAIWAGQHIGTCRCGEWAYGTKEDIGTPVVRTIEIHTFKIIFLRRTYLLPVLCCRTLYLSRLQEQSTPTPMRADRSKHALIVKRKRVRSIAEIKLGK